MELGSLIKGRYKVEQELSTSSSNSVYRVFDQKRTKSLALKFYNCDQSSFQSELDAYAAVRSSDHFIKVYSSGLAGTGSYIIMNLLKESIQNCVRNSKFPLPVILDISYQLLCRLETLHNASYVHRKLSPKNLMTGFDDSKLIIYLIDFTKCKKFREPASKIHHKYSEGHGNTGSLRFCSVNTLRGIDYSRRDDLESWFYVTIYLIKLKLPWDMEAKNHLIDKVLNLKTKISSENICKDIPNQFTQIFNYVKGLRYEENPDYCFLKKLVLDSRESINSRFLYSLTAKKPLKEKNLSKSKRYGSHNVHVSFLEFETLKCIPSMNSKQFIKSSNSTPKKNIESILRSKERNETVKGVMPEFKNRNKIFNNQLDI